MMIHDDSLASWYQCPCSDAEHTHELGVSLVAGGRCTLADHV